MTSNYIFKVSSFCSFSSSFDHFFSDEEVIYADALEYEDETMDDCNMEPEVEIKDDDVEEITCEEEEDDDDVDQ